MNDELKAVVERLKWSCDLREAQITETALVARTDLLTVIAALDNPITLSGVQELLAKERERVLKVIAVETAAWKESYMLSETAADGQFNDGGVQACELIAKAIRNLENQ